MTDLTQLERIARAASEGDWKHDTRRLLEVVFTPNRQRGAITITHGDTGRNRPLWGSKEMAKADAAHIATFNPQTVLDLIERVRAAEGKLEEIRQIEKAPDDEHDEYGFNSCHIEGYNSGLEICQEIARRAAALHTEGGE